MPLINRKTISEFESSYDDRLCFIAVYPQRVMFTAEAVKRFKLMKGRYIHFTNDGSVWTFYMNQDPDGFLLESDENRKKKSSSLIIFSRALARMFSKSTNFKPTMRFRIKKTYVKQNGATVHEIITKENCPPILVKK